MRKFVCNCLTIATVIILTAITGASFSGSYTVTSEQAKKEAWIDFCTEKLSKCRVLASTTAIPLATTLKKKANGTFNTITTTFSVESFQGINELEHQFSLQGTFLFEWELPDCAKWPQAKGGESPNLCAIPRDNMWHPSFYHSNALGSGSPFDTGVDQVTITNRGEAIWYARGQFDSQCTLSFKNFPFDEQTCSLVMRWQRLGDSQNVQVWPSMTIKDGTFGDSSIWILLEHKTKIRYYDGMRQVEFTFKLRRRFQAYAGTIFLPMVLLMFIQTSVFWMPAEMADRTGMSMTIFLSSAVLLTVISQSIPATAEMLGIVVLFGAQTALGVAITIYTTISLRFADHYAEKCMERKSIKFFGLKFNCTRINFIDSVAALITIVIYAIISLVILGLMITNSSYSPFYTEPPAEEIVQNEMVHRALGQAAADGRIDEVMRLLELPGIDVNWWDERNFSDCGRPAAVFPTALRRAVSCNHTQVVGLLLENGARINETDADRQTDTFVIMAVLYNNTEMMRLLLDYNASVVQLNNDSEIFNALAAAAYTGNADMAKELLYCGAIMSDTNSSGSTIAMIAAAQGNQNFIIEMDSDFDGIIGMRDAENKTVLFYVARSGNEYAYLHLLDRYRDKVDEDAGALQVAAMYGHSDMFRWVLSCSSYAILNEYNETALFIAIRAAIQGGWPGNHTTVVSKILSYMSVGCVDVNVVGRHGQTPLMLAASLPTLGIARMLLRNGANVSQADDKGWTPFFYAAQYGTYEMLQLLIEYGDNVSASIQLRNEQFDTLSAFFYAAGNCDSRILKYLYNATSPGNSDGKLETEDDKGNTPLMLAAANGCLENVRFLLDLGAKLPNYIPSDPMAHALRYFAIVRLLVEKVKRVVNKGMGTYNMRPLHIAALRGINNTLVFQYLLAHGADVNATATDFIKPLMLSILGKQTAEETVQALLKRNADVNFINSRRWSALMFAAMRGNPTVVTWLIERGADVNPAGLRMGLSPLLIAACYGNAEVVHILLQNGAKINGRIAVTPTSCINAVSLCNNEINLLNGELSLKGDDIILRQQVDEIGSAKARTLLKQHFTQQPGLLTSG